MYGRKPPILGKFYRYKGEILQCISIDEEGPDPDYGFRNPRTGVETCCNSLYWMDYKHKINGRPLKDSEVFRELL
jgi:hypothetical protein